jgi:DNA-binding transcriptional MerR regulator
MSSPAISPDSRLTIGRFARLTGLSARTLRKYDALGLLPPATIDPDTGYRHYSLFQVPRAETIRLLRSLDVPLAEIASILDSEDPTAAKRLLESQLRRVRERMASDRHTVMRLESAVTRGGALGAYHCELREVPAQPVIALRITSPRTRVDAVVEKAVVELTAVAGARRLAVTGREIVVYDFDPLEQDDYVADVCLPLSSPIDGDDGIRSLTLPGCTAAFTVHHGPGEDLQSAYCCLLGWIVESGLRIAGHERERYVIDERDTSDPREHITEIMWPVEAPDREADAELIEKGKLRRPQIG